MSHLFRIAARTFVRDYDLRTWNLCRLGLHHYRHIDLRRDGWEQCTRCGKIKPRHT